MMLKIRVISYTFVIIIAVSSIGVKFPVFEFPGLFLLVIASEQRFPHLIQRVLKNSCFIAAWMNNFVFTSLLAVFIFIPRRLTY